MATLLELHLILSLSLVLSLSLSLVVLSLLMMLWLESAFVGVHLSYLILLFASSGRLSYYLVWSGHDSDAHATLSLMTSNII